MKNEHLLKKGIIIDLRTVSDNIDKKCKALVVFLFFSSVFYFAFKKPTLFSGIFCTINPRHKNTDNSVKNKQPDSDFL